METKIATTFIKVAELGNITRAAEQLGYSQGAVTLQIKQLENEVGVPLFDRIGRRIKLTDAGERFREYAERLVQASKDAEAFAMDAMNPTGSLVIEANASVAIGLLPSMLPEVRRTYPGISLRVRITEDIDMIIDHIRQIRTEFAMIMGPLEDYEGCRLVAQRKEVFRFIATRDDPLAEKKNVSLSDVLDESFVPSFATDDKDMKVSYVEGPRLADLGYKITPMVEFGSCAGVANYLKGGSGRGYLPLYLIEDELRRGELCIIDTEDIGVHEHIQLICSSTRWISPQMKVFIEYVQSKLQASLSYPEKGHFVAY